jgi:hypothetical protein
VCDLYLSKTDSVVKITHSLPSYTKPELLNLSKDHTQPSYTKPELLNLSLINDSVVQVLYMKVSCVWSLDRFSSSGFVYEGLKITHSLPSYTKPELLNLSKDHTQPSYTKPEVSCVWSSIDRFSSSGFVYEGCVWSLDKFSSSGFVYEGCVLTFIYKTWTTESV